MELTSTLISLQGVLTHLSKTTHGLTKIKHKGGNEMKISTVVNELKTFLIKEKCIIDDEFNDEKANVTQDIVFFLALNCEFNEELQMKGYEHLMGINVNISTCLFANVITELCLVDIFAKVLEKFPLNVYYEILQEFLICFKKTNRSNSFSFVMTLLTTVVKQLNANDEKLNEQLEGVVKISTEILDVIKNLNAEDFSSPQNRTVYREMGYRFLKLLQLLLLCDPTKEHLSLLIKNIISISSDIIVAVTVNIFCEWAEVEENGEPLQAAVGAIAYYVIQKYSGYQPAKTLLQMLGTFARKPISIEQLIMSADAEKMIRMIKNEDENQKQWFKALLRTQVFSNKASMDCVEKYYYLCDETDVERILNFCRGKEIDEEKLRLVLKCVSVVPLKRLVILITRYFRSYGIHTALSNTFNRNKLVVVLNKLEKNENDLKEILLLLLQNFKEVLCDLYRECLKNSIHSVNLKEVFVAFKEIIIIENASLICLQSIITEQIILENYEQLTALLKTLTESDCVKYDAVVNDFVVPNLQEYSDNNFCLLNVMIVVNGLYIPKKLTNPRLLIEKVFVILKQSRCYFYNYDETKQNIVKECVKFLLKCEECDQEPVEYFQENTIDQYYVKNIFGGFQGSLVDYLFPNSRPGDGTFIGELIKTLPRYVSDEWKEVASALQSKFGTQTTVKTLTDVLTLMSAIKHDQLSVTAAFQNCLNNYMIAIQNLQQSSMEAQIIIARNVCYLLRHLPSESLEKAEIITTLISTESLKTLLNDNDFMKGVDAIPNNKIRKLISSRML